MTEPTSSPSERPTPGIRIGSLTLTGVWGLIAALIIVGAIVALTLWSRPRPAMLVSAGVWLGFLVFWSVTAKAPGVAESQETVRSRAVHQNLTNLGLLLLFVPVPGLRWRFVPPSPWLVPIGLSIEGAATLLHVWARVHLGRNWSSPVQIKTDHRLVRTGPYRLIRHPIYTAILGLAAGTALVSGRVVSLLGAAVFAAAYARKIRIEERALGDRFGAEWESYRRSSRALIPWVY